MGVALGWVTFARGVAALTCAAAAAGGPQAMELSVTGVVLYDRELHEALTIIEIPASFMRKVERREAPPYFRVYAPRHITMEDFRPSSALTAVRIDDRIVSIKLEEVRRSAGIGGSERLFWFGYPDDPELALELRAAFLPGQLGETQRREKDAFWRGAFTAAAVGL